MNAFKRPFAANRSISLSLALPVHPKPESSPNTRAALEMAYSQDLNPAKAALLIFLQQKFYEWAYCHQIVLTCLAPALPQTRLQAAVPAPPTQPLRDLEYERRVRKQQVPLRLRETALSFEKIAIEGSEARSRFR